MGRFFAVAVVASRITFVETSLPPTTRYRPFPAAMIGDSVLRHRRLLSQPAPTPAEDPFAPYRGLMAEMEEKERPSGWRRVWYWLTCRL